MELHSLLLCIQGEKRINSGNTLLSSHWLLLRWLLVSVNLTPLPSSGGKLGQCIHYHFVNWILILSFPNGCCWPNPVCRYIGAGANSNTQSCCQSMRKPATLIVVLH